MHTLCDTPAFFPSLRGWCKCVKLKSYYSLTPRELAADCQQKMLSILPAYLQKCCQSCLPTKNVDKPACLSACLQKCCQSCLPTSKNVGKPACLPPRKPRSFPFFLLKRDITLSFSLGSRLTQGLTIIINPHPHILQEIFPPTLHRSPCGGTSPPLPPQPLLRILKMEFFFCPHAFHNNWVKKPTGR